MAAPVVFKDLAPRASADAEEDAWIGRLAAHLDVPAHVVSLGGQRRVDEEPILSRLPDGRWFAGRYIGDLRFEGRALRIEPRLGIEVIGEWLATAMNLTAVPRSASVGPDGTPLIAQLLDRVWASAVAGAARHGGPRFRDEVRSEGLFVRGRLDTSVTLRTRATGGASLTSVQRVRSYDNPVAKLLVGADRVLRDLIACEPTWRPEVTRDMLLQLRSVVGPRPTIPTLRDLRRVRFTPITRPYESVAKLSLQIVNHQNLQASAIRDESDGVLLDVAELWELFLVASAQRAFGVAHVVHDTKESSGALFQSRSKAGATIGRLKPDILVTGAAGQIRAVVDAKYKRLAGRRDRPSGVDRADLYQLAAYLSGHDTPLGALVYPANESDRARADIDGPWSTTKDQRVEFSRFPVTLHDAAAAFTELVA